MKTNAVMIALFIITSNLKAETSLVGFRKESPVQKFGTQGTSSLVGFQKEEFSKKNNAIPFFVQGADKPIDYKVGGFHNEDFVAETIESINSHRNVGCEQKVTGASADGFDRNVLLLNAPFIKINCDSVEALRNQKQLTPDICVGLAGCLKSKVDFRSSDAAVLFKRAREQAARESVALTAKAGISQMIDYESLRRYAELKYGKDFIPKSCRDVDILRTPAVDEDGNGCNLNLIDEGYELAQNLCRVPEVGCNFEYLDYIKNKKRESLPSQSFLSSFIDETSAKKAQEGIGQDTRMLQTISYILADSSLSQEKRVEKTMEYIYSNFNKMDPILKSYYDRSISTKVGNQKDPISEGLLSYLKINEHKSSVDILVDLEELRRNEAKSLLESKCHKVNTISGFCGAVQDIVAGGAEVMVDKKDFDKMLSRKPEITDSIMTRENMAYNVARCNTFNLFETTNGIVSKNEIRLSQDLDLFSDNNGASFRSEFIATARTQQRLHKPTLVIDPNGLISKSDKPVSSLVGSKLMENRERDKGADLLLVRNFSKNIAMPESVKREEPKSLILASGVKKEEENIVSANSNASMVSNSLAASFSLGQKDAMMMAAGKTPVQTPENVIANLGPIIQNIQTSETEEVKDDSSSKKQYNQMVEKIAGLEEKLAKTQKKLSPEEEVKTISAPAESESDLIKELKNARNALVEMNKKKDITQGATVAANEKAVVASSRARASEDLYSSEEALREASRDARENGSGSAQRNSGAGRSVASRDSGERYDGGEGHKFNSSSRSANSEESAYVERGESIVLTKVDGVTNTKMNQTIKDLIYAESGKPFFIEENGMVKQIIPEVVNGEILVNEDGTPVYKTVVKGKVGEFKVDLKDKKEKNDKKMAKQNSAADVKKSDEKSGPVVRYRDLKDVLRLTTEASKKD